MKALVTIFSMLIGVSLIVNPGDVRAGKGQVIFADTVYHNGKVLTVDQKFSIHSAFAVRGTTIMAVGSDKDMLDLAGARTVRFDLKGRTVIPGFIDTHNHLFDYAVRNWRKDLEKLEPQMRAYRRIKLKVKSIADAAKKIKAVVAKKKPGLFVRVRLRPIRIAEEFGDRMTIKDLDALAPNNPLVVRLRGTRRVANTATFKLFSDHYGVMPPEFVDAKGRLVGGIGSGDMRILVAEILVKKSSSLAAIYHKEMQAWAAHGVTTFSTSLPTVRGLAAFRMLDEAGKMAIRFAYGHRMGVHGNPHAPGFYARLGDLSGHGSDYIWFNGVAARGLDSSYPRMCSTVKAKAKIKKRERCYGREDSRLKMVFAAIKAGHRFTNTHVFGDRAVDYTLDLIEEASKAGGFGPAEIRSKRHGIDHCGMSPRPDQIERGKKLNVVWSCAPKYIDRAADMAEDYGYDAAHNLTVPIKAILNAGGRVVLEMDDRRIHGREGGAMRHLEWVVTRKDSNGQVWGKHQAISKRTALELFTRLAAYYVLREDRLGSLETGKLADFVILDKDYLAVSGDDLSTIKVLMTVVGGRTVYTEPKFAEAEGLAKVGLKR